MTSVLPDFTVFAKRPSGIIVHDTFGSESPNEAENEFKDCYRHDDYDIVDTVTEPIADIDRLAEELLGIFNIYERDDESFFILGSPEVTTLRIRVALREAYMEGHKNALRVVHAV
jgi:hypothetical protein